MQFEYDPERLIEEVKKRPGLWDFNDVNYRSREMRHKLWTEIVEVLLQTNVKVSKSEKRELEIQLQKKWKSIRDCFQKYLQNPNRTRRPYIYFKQLKFITKDQDTASQNDEATSESDDDKPAKSWVMRKKLRLVKHEDSPEGDNNQENYQEEASYSNDDIEIEVPKPKSSKTVDDFVFASVGETKFESDDPDKMFLLSLLPHLKAIPEECRLDVKMNMMDVLRNAKYNSETDHKIL